MAHEVLRVARPEDHAAVSDLLSRSYPVLMAPAYPADLLALALPVISKANPALLASGRYAVIERADGKLAGCGGWSRRATLYGGSHSAGRDSALLDPSKDPARVRAMYTHPAFTRRGVGRLIVSLCEAAAAAQGFSRVELMATRSGRPLYEAAGFVAIEEVEDSSGGAPVPLTRMGKPITPMRSKNT